MADEAVIVELLGNGGDPVEYTVADGTTILKGTILKIGSDPRTAVAADTDGDLICGIAAAEKVASDGATTLAVYTNGIFDIKVKSGGSATLGKPVKIDGANTVDAADDDTTANMWETVGVTLETGSASEVIQIRVLK